MKQSWHEASVMSIIVVPSQGIGRAQTKSRALKYIKHVFTDNTTGCYTNERKDLH